MSDTAVAEARDTQAPVAPEHTADSATPGLEPGKILTVYGRHRFQVGQACVPEVDETLGWLRLSPYGLTPCQTVDHALYWIENFMRVWREVDTLPIDKLPDGFGMLSDWEGQLRYVVREDGTIFELHTLGARDLAPQTPARVSIFSLLDDLLAQGDDCRRSVHAYRFALGEPVGFDA